MRLKKTELKDTILRIAQLDERIRALNSEKDSLKGALLDHFAASGTASTRLTAGSSALQVTMIAPERFDVNPDRLKKSLGAKLWAKVTTPTLDKDKLEAMIVTKQVDPVTVADCSDRVAIKPYIKMSGSWKWDDLDPNNDYHE